METLTVFNGNGQEMKKELPALRILGYINDGALNHIKENTGLEFVKDAWGNYDATPTESGQIVRLFLTYNFKTQYNDNSTNKNVILLKSDHHQGFHVDSICFDCVKRNNISIGGLSADDFLAC